MVKTAGSRNNSKREKRNLDEFWKPLDDPSEAPKQRIPLAPPLGARKRPRTQPTGDPAPWTQTERLRSSPPSGQPNWQRNKHAHAPMATSKGKPKRLMSPSACVNFHPFTETLRKWEDGVPVDCGANWTREQIEAAIQQGPHRSALSPESIALIEEDVSYQVQAGYAQVVNWDDLKENLPPKLKVSPLAVVPQRNRRGRMILDLAFPVLRQEKTKGRKRKQEQEILQPSVNDTTVRLAPTAPVKELGNVLQRLL